MQKQTFIFFYSLFTLLPVFPSNDTIGSDSAVSLEAHYEFDGFNNRIAGFAAMEFGFSFQDANTTCSFDSYFPVDSLVNLKEGKLYLNKNLTFNELLEFTHSVSIYCSDYFMKFPYTEQNLEIKLPSLGNFSAVDNEILSSISYALKWSRDDKYLAINDGTSNLEIYYFDENTITLTASINVPSRIYDLDWRPNSYQIATAGYTSPYLAVYEWNVHNGTISLVDSVDTGNQVRTAQWHPSGNYLAILRQTSNELYIYSFNGNALTFVTSIDIPGGTRWSYLGDATWRSDGKYIATGYFPLTGQPELYVHSFDGTSLTLSNSAEVNSYVLGIDWHPTDSLIVTGLFNASTESLRLFRHDANANTLTEIQSARIGTNRGISNSYWSKNGKYLGIAFWTGIGSDYAIYFYDKNAQTFTLVTEFSETSGSGYLINWPNNNNEYIATCGSFRNFQISKFNSVPFYIEYANIIFNSNIDLRNEIIFSKDNTIYGNNNKIDLGENGKIIIDSNSSLILKNITLKNIKLDNLKNLSNSSSIIFDNVTLIPSNDFYLSYGNFEVFNKLKVSGNYTFSYQSNQQSIIHTDAEFKLKDGITFSYNPSSADDNLIALEDKDAKIILDECALHSTTTGISLTDGTLIVKGQCYLNSDATTQAEAIKLGTDGNNLYIDIEPESSLVLISGHLKC